MAEAIAESNRYLESFQFSLGAGAETDLATALGRNQTVRNAQIRHFSDLDATAEAVASGAFPIEVGGSWGNTCYPFLNSEPFDFGPGRLLDMYVKNNTASGCLVSAFLFGIE